MIRIPLAFTLAIAMLGVVTPVRAQIPPELLGIAGEVGKEAAKKIAANSIDLAYYQLTKKYTMKVDSASPSSYQSEPHLAFFRTVKVTCGYDEDGKLIFGVSEGPTRRLTLTADVDVVLTYPLKEVRKSPSGELLLPPLKYENVIAGYRKPKGYRGIAKYKGTGMSVVFGGTWSEQQKEIAMDALMHHATDGAKDAILEESKKLNGEVQAESKDLIRRFIQKRVEVEKELSGS